MSGSPLPTPIHVIEGTDPKTKFVLKVNGVVQDLNDYTDITLYLKKSKWGENGEGPTLIDGSGLELGSPTTSGEVTASMTWEQVRDFPWYVMLGEHAVDARTIVFGFGPVVIANA